MCVFVTGEPRARLWLFEDAAALTCMCVDQRSTLDFSSVALH